MLARRALRPLIAASVVVGSFASAIGACLPSIDFANPKGDDSGTDAPSADATQDGADGGGDARSDGAVDASLDAGPPDARPDVAPSIPLALSADFWDFGGTAACSVRAGTLYCWGDPQANQYGQLGFPDEDAGGAVGILNPTAVTTTAFPASQISQIVMAEYSTCALYGMTAYCWGSNYVQQLGNPNDTNGGPTEVVVQNPPSRGFTSLATAETTTCGVAPIVDAGDVSNVFCWGTNSYGELGRPVEQGNAPTAVPVTGDLDGGPLGVISNVVSLAGGGSHFCALTSASRIFCWGADQVHECGPGEAGTNCPGGGETTCTAQPLEVTLGSGTDVPIALALGTVHSCALTQGGNVYCWGSNDSYELGAMTSPQACSYDGNDDAGCSGAPIQVAITGIRKLFAGDQVTCGIDDSRYVYCWGSDEFGQLGLGPSYPQADQYTPQRLLDSVTSNPLTFDDLAIGGCSACGRDGSDIYCWGQGVLGTATDAGPQAWMSPQLVQF
jgi:alpha-tubulin suppressor-like RCC1 family protein